MKSFSRFIGLSPNSVLSIDFVVYRTSFTLRRFSAEFALILRSLTLIFQRGGLRRKEKAVSVCSVPFRLNLFGQV